MIRIKHFSCFYAQIPQHNTLNMIMLFEVEILHCKSTKI